MCMYMYMYANYMCMYMYMYITTGTLHVYVHVHICHHWYSTCTCTCMSKEGGRDFKRHAVALRQRKKHRMIMYIVYLVLCFCLREVPPVFGVQVSHLLSKSLQL